MKNKIEYQGLTCSEIDNILEELKRSFREKIIKLFSRIGENSVEFEQDIVDSPTTVYWTSGKGYVYEAPVIAVEIKNGKLYFKLDTEDNIVTICEEDGDLAFRCHEWLIDILCNMCQILNIDPETI